MTVTKAGSPQVAHGQYDDGPVVQEGKSAQFFNRLRQRVTGAASNVKTTVQVFGDKVVNGLMHAVNVETAPPAAKTPEPRSKPEPAPSPFDLLSDQAIRVQQRDTPLALEDARLFRDNVSRYCDENPGAPENRAKLISSWLAALHQRRQQQLDKRFPSRPRDAAGRQAHAACLLDPWKEGHCKVPESGVIVDLLDRPVYQFAPLDSPDSPPITGLPSQRRWLADTVARTLRQVHPGGFELHAPQEEGTPAKLGDVAGTLVDSPPEFDPALLQAVPTKALQCAALGQWLLGRHGAAWDDFHIGKDGVLRPRRDATPWPVTGTYAADEASWLLPALFQDENLFRKEGPIQEEDDATAGVRLLRQPLDDELREGLLALEVGPQSDFELQLDNAVLHHRNEIYGEVGQARPELLPDDTIKQAKRNLQALRQAVARVPATATLPLVLAEAAEVLEEISENGLVPAEAPPAAWAAPVKPLKRVKRSAISRVMARIARFGRIVRRRGAELRRRLPSRRRRVRTADHPARTPLLRA
jgi:hypothetical protein